MRAWTYAAYGGPDVLEQTDIETPTPGPGQVCIAVDVAGLNPADWHFMRGEPRLIRLVSGVGKPKPPAIIGSDVAGVVSAVGDGVTSFAVGDRVVAEVDRGTCADVVLVKEKRVVRIPDEMDAQTAAALPMAGITAVQALRKVGGSLAGARILVNGASGGIGSMLVQLAALDGAEVTGVCSGRNVETVQSLGAAHVIDYEREDFTEGEPGYDVIVDMIGNRPTKDLRRAVRRGGVIVQVGGGNGGKIAGPMMGLARDSIVAPFTGRRFTSFTATANSVDLAKLVELTASGSIRPLIDRVVPFDEVPAAMTHLESGHARGKILIRIR